MGTRLILTAAAALLASTAAHAIPSPSSAASDTRHILVGKAKRPLSIADADGVAETLRTATLGSFTPSIVDPSRSPVLTRAQTSERSFRFTPSGKSGDRKALTLGVTTRVVAQAEAARGSTQLALAAAPTGYNLGLSVGYLGFSLTGGYSRLETAFGPRREGVDLGLSFRGSRWKASLQASGETPSRLAFDPLAADRRYGVELGGAYALSQRLSVNGGARYQMVTPIDPALRAAESRADPAVYLGTAFSF